MPKNNKPDAAKTVKVSVTHLLHVREALRYGWNELSELSMSPEATSHMYNVVAKMAVALAEVTMLLSEASAAPAETPAVPQGGVVHTDQVMEEFGLSRPIARKWIRSIRGWKRLPIPGASGSRLYAPAVAFYATFKRTEVTSGH